MGRGAGYGTRQQVDERETATGRQTDRQTDRQAGQRDRQTDAQTDRGTCGDDGSLTVCSSWSTWRCSLLSGAALGVREPAKVFSVGGATLSFFVVALVVAAESARALIE